MEVTGTLRLAVENQHRGLPLPGLQSPDLQQVRSRHLPPFQLTTMTTWPVMKHPHPTALKQVIASELVCSNMFIRLKEHVDWANIYVFLIFLKYVFHGIVGWSGTRCM